MTDVPPSSADRPIDELYATAYDELRRRAAAIRRSDPFATISTKTLVHETWFKFSKSTTLKFASERHLIEIVVRAMRQVLVDLARYRRAGRRTGIVVPIDEVVGGLASDAAGDTLAINEALDDLEGFDPELANIVQMRYFGGFTMSEIAERYEMSESTAQRKYNAAIARLRVAMQDHR